MQIMWHADPNASVFIDVGCNTGTEAIKWLDLWVGGPLAGISRRWGNILVGKGIDGTCGQSLVNPRPFMSAEEMRRRLPKRAGSSHVVCVEPMPGNVQYLTSLRDQLVGSSGAFQVVQAAASNQVGSAQFPNGRSGAEGFHIVANRSAHVKLVQDRKKAGEKRSREIVVDSTNMDMTTVEVTTVDEVVLNMSKGFGHNGSVHVDVLIIDAEGYDPYVLQGAARVLETVRFLAFEVHRDLVETPWANTSLLGVVQHLDTLNLECFWEGRVRLMRLTGCFSEADEKKMTPIPWSNVVCLRRGDVWHEALKRFVGPWRPKTCS